MVNLINIVSRISRINVITNTICIMATVSYLNTSAIKTFKSLVKLVSYVK